MYTNFITQNSSSPYYHSIQYNGVVNEIEDKDLMQHTLLGQSNSYGINFTNYYSNQSISSIIKAEKFNNNKNDCQISNQQQLQSQPQDKNIDLSNNQLELLKEQNKQENLGGEKMRNPSKSLKRIQSDQSIISTFARSTPQFYNLSKPSQIYSQQSLNTQLINNEGNSQVLRNQQIQNSSNQNDKEKIIKISKIYSTQLTDNKKCQKKANQINQEYQEKKSSPQQQKYNKSSSLSNQVTNLVEQQFYSTLMPSFLTKTNNTLSSYRVDENKQLYVFQQQAINFQRKQKKTRSIPSSIYQNSKRFTQISVNADQSQRSQNTEENEVNVSNLQPTALLTKQQKNSIKIIKSETRNHQNSIFNRSDSKTKLLQHGKFQTGNNTQQSSQFQSHSQSLSNIMNLNKQQKSMSQKNSLTYQSILSSINSPQNSSNKIRLQKEQSQINPSNQQQNTILQNFNQTQKPDYVMDVSPSNEAIKNNNLENSSFYSKSKSFQLMQKNNSKIQANIPSNLYHYKSNSMIVPTTSQNTRMQENNIDSTQRHTQQPLSFKKNQSLYYQSGEQSFQMDKNMQSDDQHKYCQQKKSQESSPQLSASSRIPSQVLKKHLYKNNIKQNDLHEGQFNQKKGSFLVKQQQYQSTLKSEYTESDGKAEVVSQKQVENNLEQQLSPKRKVVDKQIIKEIKQEVKEKNVEKQIFDQKSYENIRFIKQYQTDQSNKKQITHSESTQQLKESLSLSNASNSNYNVEDKLSENRKLNLKKNFSQNYQENDSQFKKQSQTYTSNLQNTLKDNQKDLQNQFSEIKKQRNMSQITLSSNQQNSQKKDVINKTVEGILLEQQQQMVNKQNKLSKSPQRTSQTGLYQDNQISEYSSRIINNKIDTENKKFLLKQIEQQYQNKQQKNQNFYYQPSNNTKDYSPLASAVANKKFQNNNDYKGQQDENDNKKSFAEKIQDLAEKNKQWNNNTNKKYGKNGSFSIKAQDSQIILNKEQENDLSPVKYNVPYQESEVELNQKESPKPVEVPQQIFNSMCQINIHRPKTSEGGSRQRGLRLYQKIRNDNTNGINLNDKNTQFQTQNIASKNGDENKLGHTIKQFYATHHPSKINKLGSEGSCLQSIFQQKQNNVDKSVYEKISLPSNCYEQQYQKSENQVSNEIELNKLLVENESDLGIEEFQIEETNEQNTLQNEEYKQMVSMQQECIKNNNFIQEQNTQSNKILIRYNKSQNQQRREKQQSLIKYSDSNTIQSSSQEIIHKPKGSQLKQDFLSLFAQ